MSSFFPLLAFTGTDEAARAQTRLAAVEPLIESLGHLYELASMAPVGSTDPMITPEILAVLTSVIDNQKASVTAYLAALQDPGSLQPIDRAAATEGIQRMKEAKEVLGHLQRAIPALGAAVLTDEDGNVLVSLTAAQKTKIDTDIDRAVTKLADTVAGV